MPGVAATTGVPQAASNFVSDWAAASVGFALGDGVTPVLSPAVDPAWLRTVNADPGGSGRALTSDWVT